MQPIDPTDEPQTAIADVRFRMWAPTRSLEASVRIRHTPAGWIATSEAEGRATTGIGPSPRDAVVASLGWLGRSALSELLADLGLFDVSRRIRTLEVAALA
ncbi:MAG TPA: hypothetical protein VID25_10010 [Candidatus Limnocylindrales bacterium]|jgi:hypothetical protein